MSHRDLAQTVRRLKGLVIASIAFGLVIAPVAVYVATAALNRYGGAASADPATLRQLRLLRRIAAVLLIAWAFLLGGWVAGFQPFAAA